MKNLSLADRRFPVPGYEAAFHQVLAESVEREKVSAGHLLRGLFYQHYHIFHVRAYPTYLPLVAEEKCRCAYVPESDVGPLAISNTDDPIRGFQPAPPFVAPDEDGVNVYMAGVGSGLHFDEEPPGFFPVDQGAMLTVASRVAHGVTEAVEMLETLSPNWGRQNLLLVDAAKCSASIDKCSFNRFAAKVNKKPLIEHVSGMVCRDRSYRDYQRSLRQAYLDSVEGNWDGCEGRFWEEADRKESRLTDGLGKLKGNPTYDGVRALFNSHERPGHLCKHGEPVKEGDPNPSFTLQKHIHIFDRQEYHRWQWDVARNIPACQTQRETYRWKIFRD